MTDPKIKAASRAIEAMSAAGYRVPTAVATMYPCRTAWMVTATGWSDQHLRWEGHRGTGPTVEAALHQLLDDLRFGAAPLVWQPAHRCEPAEARAA